VSNQINTTAFYQKELEFADSKLANFKLANFKLVCEFCIKTVRFQVFAVESDRAEGDGDRETRESERKERQHAILRFFSSQLQASVIGQFEIDGNLYLIIKTQTSAHDPAARVDSSLINLLTGRELQVATLTASGRSNKQIANHLNISEWTVSAHLRRIFIKLNVDNRAAMAYRCAPLINQAAQMFE
jgi:DNA-binding CsgD family transcriptional regulator